MGTVTLRKCRSYKSVTLVFHAFAVLCHTVVTRLNVSMKARFVTAEVCDTVKAEYTAMCFYMVLANQMAVKAANIGFVLLL